MSDAHKAYTLQATLWSPLSGARSLDVAEVKAALASEEGTLWADVWAHQVDETAALLLGFGFHPLAVEDSLSPYERPALQQYDDMLFLNAHAVQLGEEAESYCEIGFFVSKNYLVTVHTEPVPLLQHWFQRWSCQPEKVAPTTTRLLYMLLDTIVDEYFPVGDQLEEKADELEEAIFSGNSGVSVTNILRVKRRLLELRQHITPLRDILNALLRRDIELIPDDVVPYLQDVYDHTLRIAELADINRDIIAGVLDAHLSVVSNRLSSVMRILTVISTILMSAALIAGIYGMNFAHMPELQWRAGYPLALASMVVVAAIELFIFWRKRWI